MLATIASGASGGRLLSCEFRPLPARPMRVYLVTGGRGPGLEAELRAAMASLPANAVVQLRVPAALAGDETLRAARLRALCPPDVHVSVSIGARP